MQWSLNITDFLISHYFLFWIFQNCPAQGSQGICKKWKGTHQHEVTQIKNAPHAYKEILNLKTGKTANFFQNKAFRQRERGGEGEMPRGRVGRRKQLCQRTAYVVSSYVVSATQNISTASTQTLSSWEGECENWGSLWFTTPATCGVPASGTPGRTPLLLPGKPPH